MDNTVVHLFNTHGRFYLYDVNTNRVIEIDEDLYKKLNNNNFDIGAVKLQEKGFLLERKMFEMRHPFDDQLESILDRNLMSMTLQVTKRCNLRCKYCVYSGNYNNRVHSNERMSGKIAYDAIDFSKHFEEYNDET